MKLVNVIMARDRIKARVEALKERMAHLRNAEKHVKAVGVWDTGVENAFMKEYKDLQRMHDRFSAVLRKLDNVEVEDDVLDAIVAEY